MRHLKIVKLNKLPNKELIKIWVSWLNDKYVLRYSGKNLKNHTIRSQTIFIKQKIKSKNSIIFKIIYKNKFIGLIEIKYLDFNNKTCEIAYLIGDKNYWNKNIAKNSVKFAVNYIKNKLKFNSIYAATININIASQKVLLKNNFKIIGKYSKFLFLKNFNKYFDKILFYKKL